MSNRAAEQIALRKTAITAATRALASNKEITVGFGESARKNTIELPRIAELPSPEQLALVRGMADAQASAIRFHNNTIHNKHRPTHSISASVFDVLEQIRLEAEISEHREGVRHNLTSRYEHNAMQQGLHEGALTPLAGVELMARKYIAKQTLPDFLSTAVTRVEMEYLSLLPALKNLQHSISNQKTYAESSLKFIEELVHINGNAQPSDTPKESTDQPQNNEQPSEQEEVAGDEAPQSQSGDSGQEEVPMFMKASGGAPPDATPQQGPDVRADSSSPYPQNRLENDASSAPYHAYITQFDEVVSASQLASPSELAMLRDQLDAKLSQLSTITSRLASKLQHLLLAKQARRWIYDEDDGMLDSKKLARVIIEPSYETIYKREQDTDFRDTVVTLLIDNSGSMRGRPITIAAISADIISRTLERCGVKVEVLGFTTREWKGGHSFKQWVKDGKPPRPGRLNDLRHIVYKSADHHYRKASKQLGLMLKDGILKENIDGEAIKWACDRLMARPEQRRILMVISDGAPVDDSTLSANSSNYLDLHLREVIAYVEEKLPIELLAIGIGHDVTRYYQKAVTISDIDKLGETMTEQLTELFS